jgi:hypothetical protein
MSVYSQDVTIQTSKNRVVSLMTDPFLLTGVLGHVNILQVYDKKIRKICETFFTFRLLEQVLSNIHLRYTRHKDELL